MTEEELRRGARNYGKRARRGGGPCVYKLYGGYGSGKVDTTVMSIGYFSSLTTDIMVRAGFARRHCLHALPCAAGTLGSWRLSRYLYARRAGIQPFGRFA